MRRKSSGTVSNFIYILNLKTILYLTVSHSNLHLFQVHGNTYIEFRYDFLYFGCPIAWVTVMELHNTPDIKYNNVLD